MTPRNKAKTLIKAYQDVGIRGLDAIDLPKHSLAVAITGAEDVLSIASPAARESLKEEIRNMRAILEELERIYGEEYHKYI